MLPEEKYFRELTEDALWQRYCGFFDLSVQEFMDIQNELLLDQIEQVADSTLGKKIMGNRKFDSVEEFRRRVPLTTYNDYEPYLSERQEDALAVKPIAWCHSSGRGGKFKWIPYTSGHVEASGKLYVGYLILAAARRRGEIRLKPGARVLVNIPPLPYASATFCDCASNIFSLQFMPPLQEGGLGFRDRIQLGFKLGLQNGVDEIASISSVLVKVGEHMAEQAQGMKFSLGMLRPGILSRLIRAWLRSRLEKREILPADLWNPKGIITGGTDTSIYKEGVAYYWRTTPLEVYGSSETLGIAVQNWNKKWLTFVPYCVFLEFIPEDESTRSREDESYRPSTVLIDELKVGNVYEVVLTHFHGMPFIRYRIGDLVRVVALSDDEAGVNLPQVVFHARVGEMIDLAGMATLTEGVIWQAIVNTGIKYEDWSACKEYAGNKTFLRLYLELNEEREIGEIERLVHEQLKEVDVDYRDIDSQLELQPVKVTLLSKGTFDRYYLEKVKEGADLAHLKPPHMNAPKEAIQQLLMLSEQV
jgi:hypothetical protein